MWTGLHKLISVHVFTDKTSPKNSKLQNSNKNRCLIPAGGLPPVILPTGVKGGRVSIINVSAGPETVGPNRYLWSQFFQTCNHHSTCYQWYSHTFFVFSTQLYLMSIVHLHVFTIAWWGQLGYCNVLSLNKTAWPILALRMCIYWTLPFFQEYTQCPTLEPC